MKKIIAIIVTIISILTVINIIAYRALFYYPDIKIHISDLYLEKDNVICFDNEYYYIKNGNIYNVDTQKNLYSTNNSNVILKTFDNLLWIFDDSSSNNLIAVNSCGEVIKQYKISNNTTDFFIDGNFIFSTITNNIKIYKIINNYNLRNISIEYSLIYESENFDFKLYKYSCEHGTCLWFDMNNDNYSDSYFAVDSNYQNTISSWDKINLLSFEPNKIVYTFSLFQLNNFVEYSFADNKEKYYNAGIENTGAVFFEHIPFYSDSKYNVSVAQITMARSIGREPPVDTSCEMKNHKSDILLIFNTKNFSEHFERKTKTFERILYTSPMI